MDIGSTESVEHAAAQVEDEVGHLDLLINNAVLSALGMDEDFLHADMDSILETFNVSALGTMRVMKVFYPLLKKGEGMSLIINISSEAGSITKCYRSNYLDYSMAKAAVNMGTMTFYNVTKEDPGINIFCVHPGWIRTDGREDNPAPLSSYDAAEILRLLFEKRRYDKQGHRFITYENEDYPF
ncbi:MAG: SDR family NAD(P)-dependent oxidoreductase [Lachnospiraceae bacterium]|nr:SDR family NAD(P)-dependent oxidoreductase [Lachnospiraceae bacterium]